MGTTGIGVSFVSDDGAITDRGAAAEGVVPDLDRLLEAFDPEVRELGIVPVDAPD